MALAIVTVTLEVPATVFIVATVIREIPNREAVAAFCNLVMAAIVFMTLFWRRATPTSVFKVVAVTLEVPGREANVVTVTLAIPVIVEVPDF